MTFHTDRSGCLVHLSTSARGVSSEKREIRPYRDAASGNPDQFLEAHYASKSEKLNALLEHKEITFELLPVFFRPNSVMYMISANSEKPRCIRFDYGQVKKSNGKMCFQLSCHYLTYDGICFGEAPVTAEIQEFQGVMKITSLGVYPLEYHAEKQKVVEELTKRGRKFMSLNGTHYRKYEGQAFYRKKK